MTTTSAGFDKTFSYEDHEYRVLNHAGSDIVRLYVKANGWAQLDSQRGVRAAGAETRADVLITRVRSGYPYF